MATARRRKPASASAGPDRDCDVVVASCRSASGYCTPTIADGRLYSFRSPRATRNRLTAYEAGPGKRSGDFDYPTDYRRQVRLRRRPALLPRRRWRPRLHVSAPRACCIASPRRRQAALEVDTARHYNVVQNLFRRGSDRRSWRAISYRRPSAAARRPGARRLPRPKGNGIGIVAFDKFTGKDRYRTRDELASYTSPMVADGIGGKRVGLYWSRHRLFGFEPATGRVCLSVPVAIVQVARKRQRRQSARRRRSHSTHRMLRPRQRAASASTPTAPK